MNCITKYLKKHKMSAFALGKKAGVSRQLIWAHQQDSGMPWTQRTAIRISAATDNEITVIELMVPQPMK